ncbi:MAG: site-specific integrase [Bacteroidia bacterium]|jgi:site-specific recombinase XerD|nr:site-specific integrase [Bacteroidia bacterium]
MKNIQKFHLSFELKKARAKNDEAPVYVKLYIDGKRLEIATRHFIPLRHWDASRAEVKPSHPDYNHINTQLSTIRSEITREFLLMAAQCSQVKVLDLKRRYLKIDDKPVNKTITQAFDYHNLKVEQLVKAGKLCEETLLRYKITKNKVIDFMQATYGIADKPLPDVKRSFVADLEHYLLTKKGLHTNTAYKYMKNLKKVLTMAIANEWMTINPFIHFKCTYHWRDRDVLTQEEIDALIEKQFSVARLAEVRDVFVFCCYTGFAYIDVFKFERDAVIRGLDGEFWLKTNRQKTGVKESVPILPIAMEIIRKYKDHPYCLAHNKLLPVNSNQRYNAYLKEMAELCGIKKNLTSHIARHTFATTITLSNGVPIETVSSMLGHKNIKTTQIYAKVVEQKVSDDMKLLREKLSIPIKKQSAQSS